MKQSVLYAKNNLCIKKMYMIMNPLYKIKSTKNTLNELISYVIGLAAQIHPISECLLSDSFFVKTKKIV